jgi:hypothetical protein
MLRSCVKRWHLHVLAGHIYAPEQRFQSNTKNALCRRPVFTLVPVPGTVVVANNTVYGDDYNKNNSNTEHIISVSSHYQNTRFWLANI